MTVSNRRRSLLAVIALVVCSLGLPAAPSSADAPTLSQDCQFAHDHESGLISSQAGTISYSIGLAAGEQIRFDSQFAANVVLTAPGGASDLSVAAGGTLRYDVVATGTHQFLFKGSPQGTPVVLRIGCGIAPSITGTEGAQYSVNDTVTPDAACVAGTNPVDTCSVGAVDTSSAGSRTFSVTATDTSGLQSTRTFHYTVAKKPQTLHFTSQPPTDAIVGYRYGYAVTAESSSGLPVVLSSDPGAPVCSVSSEQPFIYGNVLPFHAGTCHVYANQPGNDEYLPADQITMSFDIARELTTLTASKASKGVLGISATTFSADLHRRGWFGSGYGAMFAYPDQTVRFYVGGKLICSAVTVHQADGTFFGGAVATCKKPIGVQAALKYNSYTAVFEGNPDYLPSTAVGKLQ